MFIFKRHGIYEPVKYLEYIEMTGAQYIDTGIKPSYDTLITIEYSPNTVSNDTVWAIFGSRPSQGETPSFCFWIVNGNNRFDYGDQQASFKYQASSGITVFKTEGLYKYSMTNPDLGTYVDNAFSTPSEFHCNNSLYLFSIHNDSEIEERRFQGKFYNCIVTKNGEQHIFKPAIDKNGIVCIYDQYNKRYLHNMGTGQFTAGPKL